MVILAAGSSARFGEQDKLAQDLGGKMLGLHAAETFSEFDFTAKIIVCSNADHPCAAGWRALGYQIAINENTMDGQASSLAVGVNAAQDSRASAICITLADMPFVSTEHMKQLIVQYRTEDPIVASSRSGILMPPAIFGREYATMLMEQQGDQGAKSLLKGAKAVDADDPCLLDIDTPQKLAAYQIYVL